MSYLSQDFQREGPPQPTPRQDAQETEAVQVPRVRLLVQSHRQPAQAPGQAQARRFFLTFIHSISYIMILFSFKDIFIYLYIHNVSLPWGRPLHFENKFLGLDIPGKNVVFQL